MDPISAIFNFIVLCIRSGGAGTVIALLVAVGLGIYIWLDKKNEKRKDESQEIERKALSDYKFNLENNHFKTIDDGIKNLAEEVKEANRLTNALHKRLDEEENLRREKDEAQGLELKGINVKLTYIDRDIEKLNKKIFNGYKKNQEEN